MAKKRTVNIRDAWEIRADRDGDGRFRLVIESESHKIIVHLERWWVKIIAGQLWWFIHREQRELDSAKSAMREQESPK